MTFSFATSAALFLLFAAASCAPVHHACADVRNRSLELLHAVKTIAPRGSKDNVNVPPTLLWMEAKDRCDPNSLREKPVQCSEKILRVLMSYSAVMEQLGDFDRCSEFANKLKPVLKNMATCLSKTGMEHEFHISEEVPRTATNKWEEDPLCNYTMNRLFSFSILTARVFAVGDPTHHDSTQSTPCSSVG